MKANEAPEKIYCGNNGYGNLSYSNQPFPNAVEYTRTDAFIDKALAYLQDKFYFNNVFYGIVSTDFNAMEEMYEDFRKSMMEE